MNAHALLIGGWYLSIIVEILLLLRLVTAQSYRDFPIFFSFIAWDTARSLAVLAVYAWGTDEMYRLGFAATEPVYMVLFGLSGLECGYLITRHETALYPVTLAASFIVNQFLPRAAQFKLESLFIARVMIVTATLSALIVVAVRYRASWHLIILAAFCLADTLLYIAAIQGIQGDQLNLAKAGAMLTQTGCLAAWSRWPPDGRMKQCPEY